MLVDCPWVAEGCVEDKDGCSEKEGHGSAPAGWTARPELGAACGESAALSLLVDVAAQLRRKAALSKVRVLAPSASCGAAVQSELERLGAPEGRAELAVRSGARFVRYEVAVWHDTTCAPAGLR